MAPTKKNDREHRTAAMDVAAMQGTSDLIIWDEVYTTVTIHVCVCVYMGEGGGEIFYEDTYYTSILWQYLLVMILLST